MSAPNTNRGSQESAVPRVSALIRDRILSGALRAGTRISSVRQLAREMDAAGSVVEESLDQLLAEGYLEAKPPNSLVVAAGAAFKAGAAGYLTKECAPDELITAVKKIASGGNYVSLFLAEKMAFEIGRMRAGKAPHETLTGREFQVMRMIAAGLTPKKIAGELCLSVKTINSYRIRILEKMNIKTNAELIRYALENKLIE